MGLFDFIKGEVIDVIEWTSDSRSTLVYRFPTKDHAIKMGAQLTVREGQAAVFINEGALADVFSPGRYELETRNLPLMTKLQSWKHGFNSPFKAEVYFVSTTQTTDRKWGTQNPIPMRDPEIGPVRIRAFGSYGFKVSDPAKFIQEVVGTDGHFSVHEIDTQLKSQVVSSFSDALGEAKLPVFDLASQYRELGETMRNSMGEDFESYGLDLTAFIIENISLPPEVEKMMDKRASMGVLGDMGKYTQFQAAQALEAAANNPGGGAGDAMGMGAGIAMGQAMMNAMGGAAAAAPAPVAAAPAAAPAGDDMVTRLTKLKGLLDAGVISQADFDAKKSEILAAI